MTKKYLAPLPWRVGTEEDARSYWSDAAVIMDARGGVVAVLSRGYQFDESGESCPSYVNAQAIVDAVNASAAEPKAPQPYEEALGEIWKALGQLSPAMVNNVAVNKIVETAYYAAENALYKAGALKLVDGRLVVNRESEPR